MKKLLFVAVTLFLIGPTESSVAQKPGDIYGLLKADIFLPNSDPNGLKGFDFGYDAEGGAGYILHPNLAVEGAIGFYKASSPETTDSPLIPSSSESTDIDVSAIPVFLTGKGLLPLARGKIQLYGGLGFGLYFAKMKTLTKEKGFITKSLSKEENATAFGYHAVMGGDYRFNKDFAMGMETKWFQAKAGFDQANINIGGITVNLALKFN